MRWIYRLALLFALAASAFGQSFDLLSDRLPVTQLAGQFRFHVGDDPQWASASFQDAEWPLIASDRTWFVQGYRGLGGFAWYRVTVHIPQGSGRLGLYIPILENSYEVFVNGQLVGRSGEMPPQGRFVLSFNNLYALPDTALLPGQPNVFAFRVWMWPAIANMPGAGFNAPPLIGDWDALNKIRGYEIHEKFWQNATAELLLLFNLLAALLGFGLWLAGARDREYLWFGLAQTFWTIESSTSMASNFFTLPWIPVMLVGRVSFFLAAFLNLEFFVALLKLRRNWIYWSGVMSVAAVLLVNVPLLFNWISYSASNILTSVLDIPYALAVPALLITAGRRGMVEGRVLFLPFTISSILIMVSFLLGSLDKAAHPHSFAFLMWLSNMSGWPFPIHGGQLIGLLCLASVSVVLILRFARSRRDQERLAAELEAARVVQHVLIPDEVPTIPGFQIESVYQPAGQVGGDFFQIVPRREGGALIAIGDVSGKGLPAAMTVSLLVGTFRTLAHYTDGPAEILTAMNDRMLSRSQGGFTTCLVVRLDGDGTVTAANAGHIAPYVDGRELDVPNGLPLGLQANAVYSESVIHLTREDHLTLLTDGVVEARNTAGELLGFDRARELSVEPAAEIVRRAQGFGQEDDITVLTLSLAPSPALLAHA